MAKHILKPQLPAFMAKTLLPVELSALKRPQSEATVRSLMAYVFKQVRPMLRNDIDSQKLYLATSDGYFLPPNAPLMTTVNPIEPLLLSTC